jgi:methylenetetrahydrofolate dehydrogenase (NADP+)/methenyltetrahydrofolate cyclohydrolase
VIIDGKAVAARVKQDVAREVEQLSVTPGLATVLVGDDPASAIYVRMKREDCAEVGIESFHHEVPADVAPGKLSRLLGELNEDERVHGILLQLPLPDHLDQDDFISLIGPAKDVDGLTSANAGLLMQDREEAMVPCTPAGVMELLREAGAELEGARAVVIGRSILVGKPVAQLLLGANATVTHCHSRTRELAAVCREADVLIAAVGSPGLVTGDMVREGAVVIDVGTNRTEDGLVGDVDFEAARERARAITPVPGGVGPMTRAMLLVNTLRAARLQS